MPANLSELCRYATWSLPHVVSPSGCHQVPPETWGDNEHNQAEGLQAGPKEIGGGSKFPST